MLRLALVIVITMTVVDPVQARPRAWCGWWGAQELGLTGKIARDLWLARNWLVKFQRATLEPGNWAVFSRGRSKHTGHVGRIEAVKPGKILLTSGNDGGQVRTRWRSTAKLIGVVSVGPLVEVKSKSGLRTRTVKPSPRPFIDGSYFDRA